MNNLAESTLEYFWVVACSDEEECETEFALKRLEQLVTSIENDYSVEEKRALRDAAQRRLDWWMGPLGDGIDGPRARLEPDQLSFFMAVAEGRWRGPGTEPEKD